MGSKCSGLTVRAEVDSEGTSVTGVRAHQEVYASMTTSNAGWLGKHKPTECVDNYAQDVWKLLHKAYPTLHHKGI